MNKNHSEVTYLAIEMLEQLGNKKPKQEQIDLLEVFLSSTSINEHIIYHKKLTKKEILCLIFAAKGKTSSETAKLLNLAPSTIETHRKSIKQKLGCNNLTQAVFEGLRFGYIPPKRYFSKNTQFLGETKKFVKQKMSF